MRGFRLIFPPSLGQMKAGVRADLVAESLRRQLDVPVEVAVAKSYEELATNMTENLAEVVWAPPALCAQGARNARAILRVIRENGASFCSAILTRKPIHLTEEGLRGLRAAWVDPLSTSGYLLVRAHLKRLGMHPDFLFRKESFVGSFRDAVIAVASGEADICSVFAQAPTEEAVQRSLVELVGGVSEKLVCSGFTPASPSDGLLITRRASATDAEELVSLLTGERAPAVLLNACDAQRFTLAAPEDYLPLLTAT